MPTAAAIDIETLQLLGAIVEQAPDAIIFADREGLIRVWNRGAQHLFGYAAAEVIGRTLDVIIPERLRLAHWMGSMLRSSAAGPSTKDGR
jgi:PAS domain S-box-containing protein